ncbi:three-Cys-motif partner protein TcmP [Cyclobacterium marinum]|uniref:three-Cys-motif partner protein TcmP n=1 Tax=Cyclobacterium marinum TaxID=104 RepID=UPI0011EE4B31|nr:three-Cys-motif partner protein TcmP [Cyclobacterium marinum]MBI0398022.1 three-Cys-motif partner protein TcmP [Cyclobacterium marinum]
MNKFGGIWTFEKIKILEKYAKAYLEIMKDRPYWKLIYFDGFAGSGDIEIDGVLDEKIIHGAAKKIVSIQEPRLFDIYYFVELNKKKAESLTKSLEQVRKGGVYVVSEDCNKKLNDLAAFLKSKGKTHKALAFVDPCGMEVNWSSIECLKDLPVDLWILVPTGLGPNRMLTRTGKISDSWFSKLESFFGINRKLIISNFYTFNETIDLFGAREVQVSKNVKAVEKIKQLYTNKIKEVFKFVSDPYELENSTHCIMYHFFLASNNKTAVSIANDIIKKAKNDKYGTDFN